MAHHGLPFDIVLIVKSSSSKKSAGGRDECFQRDRRMIHEAASDQGELSAHQVLLIPDVLIGRNQHIEARSFRFREKLPVFKLRVPWHFNERAHVMTGQEPSHTDRDIFIKQDVQRGESSRKSTPLRYGPAELRLFRDFSDGNAWSCDQAGPLAQGFDG